MIRCRGHPGPKAEAAEAAEASASEVAGRDASYNDGRWND